MTASLFRADRLVDGTGAPPVAGAAILIEAGRLAADRGRLVLTGR
ncbi:hypothetical protein [Jiangella alkaliphila]|uniref:Uncharacterized protein n=1 Tax=Jiangella alkaliphila TaxID=419479 RepID=A0A1H2JS47_9ACTN|nr:hypothetical protein [Jiangella alkaliphila]SDU58961.1 hypothetical protein SAMN04488563_2991 [Jiangella alkaliphila]